MLNSPTHRGTCTPRFTLSASSTPMAGSSPSHGPFSSCSASSGSPQVGSPGAEDSGRGQGPRRSSRLQMSSSQRERGEVDDSECRCTMGPPSLARCWQSLGPVRSASQAEVWPLSNLCVPVASPNAGTKAAVLASLLSAPPLCQPGSARSSKQLLSCSRLASSKGWSSMASSPSKASMPGTPLRRTSSATPLAPPRLDAVYSRISVSALPSRARCGWRGAWE
jgi:hypothetical protein